MRVQDVVSFNKENYFNGAVQTEWFYDDNRVAQVACSYVFHGPKYYGVASEDVNDNKHKLIDTASFTKKIAEKLYHSSDENIILTIAGYGTGKSHLAVCLGSLFGCNTSLRKQITANISAADPEIGASIQRINNSANLVLVLNGMNNFNLDAEVLRCARLALKQNGMDDSVLRSLTKSYDIAKHFVERTFQIYQSDFESAAKQHSVELRGERLKNYLIACVESDNKAIGIINQVYTEINGDGIHWERGISAGDIISFLADSLCGEGKPFNKVLFLFDEFGRFIEYAAANPDVAGEAALQQIFEAVQNSHGKIVFSGFIQSDLTSYLARIEKTANIVRYVGRYENSEKWYLSSNFETILANLIKKKDEKAFDRTVGAAVSRYQKFHSRIMNALVRWDRSSQKKTVWTSWNLYENVVLRGCFPFHPLTVWILANTSNWMQQRSTIAFASEMIDSISTTELEGLWLPYVYPIDIIDSHIYDEMLNSEEKGLVQSQNCMLYRDIISRIGGKLNKNELKVLKAILIINICRFSFLDLEDAKTALSYCANVKDEDLVIALHGLEDMYGVIAFDESTKSFDLIAEANGYNEFSRVYTRYRLGVTAAIDDVSEEVLKELNLLKPIETSFAKDHMISSMEWQFQQLLIASENMNEQYLQGRVTELKNNYDGETPRGLLIYAYCSGDTREEINRLCSVYQKSNATEVPIIVLVLDDVDNEVITPLLTLKTLAKFSRADSERFSKHIQSQQKASVKRIIQAFNRLVNKRQMLSMNGIANYTERRNQLCSAKFEELFTKTPPFAFDGFEKKASAQAKKYLSNICRKLFDRTMMNVQGYQALTQEEKNRVRACLATDIRTSWKVFTNTCSLIEPQNEILKEIYDDVSSRLSVDKPIPFYALFGKYTKAPYGMNANELALFCMYFLSHKGNQILGYYGDEKLMASHLSDKVFRQDSLNLQEIKKLSFQNNPNAGIDVVAEKSREALRCCAVSRCPILLREMDDLISQEGTTPENQLIVADARAHLDMGIRLYEKQKEEVKRLNTLITEAKKEFKIPKFVRPAFQSSLQPEGQIDPQYPFIYEDEYKKKIAECRESIDTLLKKKYLLALERFSFTITQLSSAKATYKKISEVLRANGYEELATATDNRVSEIEKEIFIKQKYESSIVELEKDLAMCMNVTSYSYAAIKELASKMSNWRSFVSSAEDMPQSLKKDLELRIQNGETQLKLRIQSINEEIENAFSETRNAADLGELLNAEKRLSSLEKLAPAENILIAISSFRKKIQEVQLEIDEWPSQIDLLTEIEITDQMEFSAVKKTEMRKKLNTLQAKQASWTTQFVVAENEVGRMTASDCSSWLNKTQVLPEFLSHQTIEQYLKTKKSIEKQLHNCKVQGVISMFDGLDQDEKKECIRILQMRINDTP